MRCERGRSSRTESIDDMLTRQQRDDFEAQGLVRLRGVFSKAEAAAMEDQIWNALRHKHGMARDDPSPWKMPPGASAVDARLRGPGEVPLRDQPVFTPIGGPALLAALDDLIGPGRWEVPRQWGQFLLTFPTPKGSSWSRAHWHTDFSYLPGQYPLEGALVISFIGDVPRGNGGTLVLAGSHRLMAPLMESNPKASEQIVLPALLQADPWLKSLCCDWTLEDWTTRLPTREHKINGNALRVIKLDGEAGDVVVGQPWLVHSAVPNRGDRPRFMRVARIRATPPSFGDDSAPHNNALQPTPEDGRG